MITNWKYNQAGEIREFVKQHIDSNKYKTIDIGASAMYWSYPECKYVADAVEIDRENLTFFKVDLEKKDTWSNIIEYVKNNGKFDFSICSHTLEDIFNPLDLIELLQIISNKGFIAIPSKYNEFTKLYGQKYRGNAHHKQFFDVRNNNLVIYPKFSWTETDERSDILINNNQGSELSLFWENEIPVEIFGNGIPFNSDQELMNTYYNNLNN
jgi:hypothetical protein